MADGIWWLPRVRSYPHLPYCVYFKADWGCLSALLLSAILEVFSLTLCSCAMHDILNLDNVSNSGNSICDPVMQILRVCIICAIKWCTLYTPSLYSSPHFSCIHTRERLLLVNPSSSTITKQLVALVVGESPPLISALPVFVHYVSHLVTCIYTSK